MKKLCICIVAVLLLMSSCAPAQEEDSSNSRPNEPTAINGYAVPDYEVYKLPAKENGLGDTKVVVTGKLTDIEESRGHIIGVLHAEDGDWSVSLGLEQIYDFSFIKNTLDGNDVSCFATYIGFSEVLQLPSIYAETLLCDGQSYYAPIIFLNDPYATEIGEVLERVDAAVNGTDTEQEESKPEESKPVESSEPEESSDPIAYFTSGTYKVGTDIPAGEYVIENPSMSYMEVASDSTGDLNSIITNDNFKNRIYITISDGQYIQFKGKMYAEADMPAYEPVNGVYPEGMYKVGKDIPAGEYKISPTKDRGYFEVDSNSSGSMDAILANDNIENEVYQTLSDGQYIKLSSCQIKS